MKRLLIATSLLITAAAFTYETCFKCALVSGGEAKLCSVGGKVTNPWTGACCPPEDVSPECTPTDKNICSDTFKKNAGNFYTFCPLANQTMCNSGIAASFDAEDTPKSFSYDKLKRLSDAQGNPTQQDACSYEIKAPKNAYASGNLIIRFNDLTETEAFINGGGPNARSALEVVSSSVSQYKEYSVDVFSGPVFAIVIPKDGISSTNFRI
jgi:hypothetical protein